MEKSAISVDLVEKRIFLMRGHRVMVDSHLAELYGVTTGRLNEQVKRNKDRFPKDFMFQLTKKEAENLKSHFAISSWGGRRNPPYAFTEQGVAMLSSVLKSNRAVQVNIGIMRAFVKLREMLASHKDLARKLAALERKYEKHDEHIKVVFDAIRQLMNPKEKPKRRIGY